MATTTTLGYDDLPALMTRLTGDEKHDRSSLSTLDAIWVLYDRVLAGDGWQGRGQSRRRPAGRPAAFGGRGDRFLLSKGHGPTAFYAVLAAKGILPVEALDGFGAFDSPLGHHPDRLLAPGVDFSSGSLGHGLAVACGVALAGTRVFCLVGDAELEEGSNWEAVQLAGRAGLASLTALAIDNGSSTRGWPGGIEARFALEGWTAVRVDGRDHDALEAALIPEPGRSAPHCVVAEVRP